MNIFEKLKGYRTVIVVVLGLAPVVADAVNAVDLDNGVLVAISSGALALAGVLRAFTNTPLGKRS